MEKFQINEPELVKFLHLPGQSMSNARRNSRRLARESLYENIVNFLQKHFKSKEIHFYGSRMMGLANHFSDLDIFVDISQAPVKCIDDLKTLMYKSPDWKVKIWLPKASCPVLRCVYLPKNLECDITFDQPIALHTTKLVRHLFEIQPEAVRFLHAIRIWLKIAGGDSKQKKFFKRFQLVLLVIFYLQQGNFMPTIREVQKRLQRKYVGDWEVQFDKDCTLSSYHCNPMMYFKKHLAGFFNFYGSFDFATQVVFPYEGKSVPKINYPDSHEMSKFKGDVSDFKWNKPMAVAGLLSFNYNITYDVGKDRLVKFRQICEKSERLING